MYESWLSTSTQRSRITSLSIQTQWPFLSGSGAKPPCEGAYLGSGGANGMVDCGFVSYRRVERTSFSDPQTHVHGVKKAISGAVAVIH